MKGTQKLTIYPLKFFTYQKKISMFQRRYLVNKKCHFGYISMSDFTHVGWVIPTCCTISDVRETLSISRGSAGDSNRLKYLWNVVFFGPSRKTWTGNFLRPQKRLGRFQCKVVSWRLFKDFLLNLCHFYTRNHWGKYWSPFMEHQQICDFGSLVHQIFEIEKHTWTNIL